MTVTHLIDTVTETPGHFPPTSAPNVSISLPQSTAAAATATATATTTLSTITAKL
jgi:hypothetical protein